MPRHAFSSSAGGVHRFDGHLNACALRRSGKDGVRVRTRAPYPEEFRREAVALVCREGRSIRDVAESLGISEQSLRALAQTDPGQLDERPIEGHCYGKPTPAR